MDPELRLLMRGRCVQSESLAGDRLQHELQNAPLFTHDALTQEPRAFQQRGLLGSVLRQQGKGLPQSTKDPRLYINTSAPCSAIVCGVQGSGKSHTVSCLLECSLIADEHIGSLPEPLSAIVFHFDEDNGDRPCEAAFLAVPHRDHPLHSTVEKVTVLVSPSNLQTRRKVYAKIPNIDVQPLYLSEENLSAGRMLSMMGGDDIERMPLYMHKALSILRKMGSDAFDYKAFKKQLVDSELTLIQKSFLTMRTDLLDSYLDTTAPSISSWFDHGKLVIVDLSDPFLDGTSAASLFEIVLGIFVEWRSHRRRSKKIIVLDEAHKYLTNSDNARLTKSLSSLIRQQRHLGVRIIVSTQEPTVIPATILDLSSYIVCHRFSSPSWCTHLKRHICLDNDNDTQAPWIEEVMQLRTGEALVFSPSTVAVRTGPPTGTSDAVARLGTGYLKILTRPRITVDGGFSVMAVDSEHPDGLPEVEMSLSNPMSRNQTPIPLEAVTSLPTPPEVLVLDRPKTPSPGPSPGPSLAPSFISGASLPSPLSKTPSCSVRTPLLAPQVAPTGISSWGALPPQVASPSTSSATLSTSKRRTNSASQASASNSAPAKPVPPAATKGPFWELVEVLNLYKNEGITAPCRTGLYLRLNCLHPSISRQPGFKLRNYLKAAEAGGYVKLRVGRLPDKKPCVSLP